MNNFIKLGLRGDRQLVLPVAAAPVEAWKRVAADALDVLCDALNAAEDGDWDDERAETERCRAKGQGKNRICVKSTPFIANLLNAGRKRLG